MKSETEFNIELKFPEESVPLYTAEDYIRDINNGAGKDYDRLLKEAESRGQGFGFVYMSAIEKSVKGNGRAWGEYNRIRKDASDYRVNMKFDNTGNLLNSVLETTYTDASAAMQAYIIEKDGVIDCWPDCRSASTYDFYNIRKDGEANDTSKVSINYFSPKIQKKSDDEGTCYYRPAGLFYRNPCPSVRTSEKKSLDKKIHELMQVRTYKKGEKFSNNAKNIIVALPLIIAAISALLMILWRITGTDVEAFMDGINWNALGKIGNILLFVPSFLLIFISVIYQFLESTLALTIGVVVLLIAGFVGYGFLGGMIEVDRWISKKAVQKGEEAQKELQALKESDDYKRIIEENAKYVKSNAELSMKWHMAWFERIKGSFI